ncbi:hypothetical protein [Nucisporomicrobium flavum]|uniref:hypothetical protein n=1 Tax=Nucisporomicrobium flavum TaxID=2785915 RepID=UPI0018F45A33|nr:hypothetical protein [Nucisporomicrobium flavum]
MAYLVEVERVFRARQGLPSPVLAARGGHRLGAGEDIEVVLRAGVAFDDDQLTARGWYVDTDELAVRLERWAEALGDGPWTARFPFRPTFELVARHLYGELASVVPQLAHVELVDRTYGSRTRYCPTG